MISGINYEVGDRNCHCQYIFMRVKRIVIVMLFKAEKV